MSESQLIEYKESWRDEYHKWICVFANNILDNCTGTSYPTINSNFLKTILIPLSSKDGCTNIANVLSSMDKEIESLNTKLEKYCNLKTFMMQQLLMGKIRLR